MLSGCCRRGLVAAGSCSLWLASVPAFAHEGAPAEQPLHEEPPPVEAPVTEVTITGERSTSEAASRVHVTRRELELRPKRRTGEVFEAVPGLFAAQHAGGGKADQWFLRGFDADHGTDVALFVDGVPVNLVSHGHGQGYADVNFLIDSEIVWSGDGGFTEPSGGTRRYGLELGGRYQLDRWLFADADLTVTHAEYRDEPAEADAVALAPRRTFTAGIAARPTFGNWTPFGTVRVRSLADRPASEDRSFTAEGFTTLDVTAGARFENVEAGLDVQNLLGEKYREVNFANESRLPYEPVAVTGIHYTPGWPRTVMARAAVYWD